MRNRKNNVAACEVMDVVNWKTPFIFISKTSAGYKVRYLLQKALQALQYALQTENATGPW